MATDQAIVDELLKRKKARTLKAELEDEPCRRRPLDPSKIAVVEATLGHKLPPLLVRLYCEVANGGFGDSYGLIGLVGGARADGNRDACQLLRAMLKPDPDDPKWKWPDGLLAIGNLGCAMYHCIDCRNSKGKIILFEPNDHEEGRSWKNSFMPFSPSLNKLFSDWLEGKDLWGEVG